MCGIRECQKCRVDSFGYDWKKLLLGLRTVLAAGPAGCVDWMVFMRGAAAQFLFFPFDNNNRPLVPGAFNDLRFVAHGKA